MYIFIYVLCYKLLIYSKTMVLLLLQEGNGGEPYPGPSHRPNIPQGLQYNIWKKSERTYVKNAAVDWTYQVKIDERHHGERIEDIREGLHQMFHHVLQEARGNLAGNDFGRVVIQHDGLHDPIIIPLKPWEQLNVNVVMGTIEKVLNSNQTLTVDESMGISIGSVDLPKGSGGSNLRITKIKEKGNSLELKRSVITIENDDNLMARAIGVSWAKLMRCTPEEWAEITKSRGNKTNLQLVLEHRKVSKTCYKVLTSKKLKQQGQLAEALCQMAGVSMDRPASLNDIEAFEEVLRVW